MRRASTRLLSHGTRFSPAVLGVLVVALGVSGYFIIASFAVATVTSAKSGNWSDAATWSGGKVPAAGDSVVVADGHTITYDANFSGDSALAGVKVNAGATLQFDPNKSATLQSTKNMVVEGVLRLRPGSVGIIQLIRFTGINEANFVGGGMNVLDSDVGLWVMGAGQLDVQGSPKTSWTRAAGAVAKGASSVVLASAPTGWQPGDELSIVPTEAPRLGSDGKKVDPASYRNFDETTVKSISGNTVNLNKATAFDHPKVNNTWTAEVMNLSRNARIEGTAAGQSHIFIRSTKPQTINHAELRHMGPRTGTDRKEFVLGRYGIHLHHSFEGSRGSIVDGTVIRDTESHAFVPHASHGVTFKNIIGYNLVESGFWWDHASETDNEPDSNDILVDGAILAKVSAPGNNDPAYFMVQGERNAVRNSVAVGMVGPSDSSGFGWPKGLEEEEVWDFTDNLSHNNAVHGMRTWMNDDGLHFIKRFAAYHNGKDGIFVGAYSNYFSLTNLNLYGNLESGVNFHAVSKKVRDGKPQLTLENSMIDGGGIGSALINAGSHNQRIDFSHRTPTIVRNVTLRGAKGKSIQLFHGNVNGGLPDIIDFIGTGLQPTDFSCDNITDGTRIRIQNDNTSALQLDKTCRSTTIQPFTTVSTTPTPPPPSPANTPPTVSLTAPAQNAAFTASATINLAATASDAGGSVAKVEFYQGTTKLGEDTTSPYGFSWANVPAGNYSLTARATDNQGAATVSSAVAVSVSGGGGTVDTTPPAKPTGVNATATAATRVELSWAANPSADGVVKY
ncbi:MAG TPA: Ig-like domain-containing protein, partial [Candidatus Saccharimonadales bacterium]|nr:Ig-like domain-containing protein [Candidatus Saccharimonadales bacterium]